MKKAQKSINTYFKSKSSPKKSKAKEMEEEEKIETPKVGNEKISNNDGILAPYDDFADDLMSWKPKLSKFINSKKFKAIYDYIKTEYKTKTIFPPANLIFSAFKLTPFNNLKVVVVGQDPYYKPNQAMGLSFSVPIGIKTPPSLTNIYKCIENDKNITGFKRPKHGDLTKWATQGVFLLNGLLTVEENKPEAHKKSGWSEFTDEVIKVINENCEGIIFLLWGLPSQKKAKIVDSKKHFVLNSSHPSPLSASRGFLTCQHFSEVNRILKEQGKDLINWNLN